MDSQMRQKPLSAVSKEDALIKTATPDKPGVEPCHPLSLNGSRLLGDEMAAEMEEEGGGRDAGRRPFSITTRTEMGPAVSLVEQMLSQVSLSSFDPVKILLFPSFTAFFSRGSRVLPSTACAGDQVFPVTPHSLAGSEYHSSQGSSLRTDEATSVDKSEGGKKRVLLSHTIHLSLSPIQIHLCPTSMLCGYVIIGHV